MLFEVTVRDSNTGKLYVYVVNASGESLASTYGHQEHHKATGHGSTVIKVVKK